MHRVLDRMYVRMTGADPKEVEQLVMEREQSFSACRHRGCQSCKQKLMHGMGDTVIFHPPKKKKKKKKKKKNEGPPEWLTRVQNLSQWTIGTLLPSPDRSQTAPAASTTTRDDDGWGFGNAGARMSYSPIQTVEEKAAEDLADAEGWDTFMHSKLSAGRVGGGGVGGDDGGRGGGRGGSRSQTAAAAGGARFKPAAGRARAGKGSVRGTGGTGRRKKARPPATAPAGGEHGARSSRTSPRSRRTIGMLFADTKPIDATTPQYIRRQMQQKTMRPDIAQNTALSYTKGIFNAVTIDPHNDEYDRRKAKAVRSYARVTLPRTDLSNKLARLRSAPRPTPRTVPYRNSPGYYDDDQ